MAKELLISFIYDGECCQREEDDPESAVVYFHPTWINDDQKLALCGQLMGVTQFMSLNFERPSIIAFSCGKFAVRYFQRYLLFVGTDRNLPDVSIQTRAETLFQLIKFYHKDIETISEVVSRRCNDNLTDKLNHIFQVYLPVLQYAANIFGSIPTFRLPKSANKIFLEAMQVLRSFQENMGVVGGVILYQNRVIASQLSPDLTKLLVITDPYRIKVPAENVPVRFTLPVGVQLLTVYVDEEEVERLKNETQSLLGAINKLSEWRSQLKDQVSSLKTNYAKEPGIGLKRDVSRNFALMEEDEEEEEAKTEASNSPGVPDLVKDIKAHSPSKSSIFNSVVANTITVFPNSKPRSHSAESLPVSPTIPVRYYSLGLPQFNAESYSDNCCNLMYNTISDPLFPFFKTSGLPASKYLFDKRITNHYSNLCQNLSINGSSLKVNEIDVGDKKSEVPIKQDKRPKRPTILNLHSTAGNGSTSKKIESKINSSDASFPIPLTPLMAKLNDIAAEQNRQGPASQASELEPLPEDDLSTALSELNIEEQLKQLIMREESINRIKEMEKRIKEEEAARPSTSQSMPPPEREGRLEEMGLFVYGYQNTTLLLLLKPETSHDSAQINSLHERSVSHLQQLESHLVHALSTVSQDDNTSDSYSFLVLDPDWGTFYRGGVWVGEPLELLSAIHYDMKDHPDMNEIILRSDDSIVYGSQCGRTQTFYQQNSKSQQGGLPAPSDLMGMVSLKAKRRLERDHGFIIF